MGDVEVDKIGVASLSNTHSKRQPPSRNAAGSAAERYPAAKFHDSGHGLDEDELIAFLADYDGNGARSECAAEA